MTENPVAPAVNTATGTRSVPVAASLDKDERGAKVRAKLADWAIKSVFVAALILVWHLLHAHFVVKTEAWSGALFPSPAQVFSWMWSGFGLTYLAGNYVPPPGMPMPKSFWEALQQADYPPAVLASLVRLVKGYLVAIAIGFPIGLLVARFSLVDRTVGWMSLSLQALPSICWIPLALLWFGRISTEAPILFVTIAGAVFATVVSVADGIRNVPPIFSRAGRTLGASGPRLYLSVLFPAALPGIVTGLKIGWSFAYRSLMAAELIVNAGGLGFLLQRDRDFGDADGVLATILVVLAIGVGVQGLIFAPLEKKLQRLWGLEAK